MAEEKLPSFEDEERKVLAQTLGENRDTVSLIERALNLLPSGLSFLDGKQPKDDADRLLLYLVTRAVNSLRCAQWSLMHGYYTQALTLVRTAMEDWLTATYVLRHREAAKYWLEEEYVEEPKSKEVPSFRQMREELPSDLRNKVNELYGLLSQFAHPRYRAFAFIVEHRGSSIYLRLGPHYDRLQFVGACDALLRVASLMGSILALFVGNHDQDWIKQRTQLQSHIGDWVDAVHREAGAPTRTPKQM